MMSNKVEFDTTVGVELYLIELVRRYECNMLLWLPAWKNEMLVTLSGEYFYLHGLFCTQGAEHPQKTMLHQESLMKVD